MKNPLISIIVRSFNEARHIGRLMAGIHSQSLQDFEVIIVDSGSTDGTVEAARKWPVRTLAVDPGTFSFGRSLNVGCAAARGEYLIFISAHCYPVRATWLEHLIEPLSTRDIAVSYGRQSGNGRTKYSEHRIFAQWFPEHSVPRQNHPFYNNANAATRRTLWKAMPFNEELTGLEDLEWGKRLRDRGYHIAYVAEAEIIHEHEETYRRIHNRYLREAMAIHKIYPEESFSLFDFARLSSWNTLKDWRQAQRERVFVHNFFAIPAFRLMQFWGTYRGYNRRDLVTSALRQRFYYPAVTGQLLAAKATDAPATDIIDYAMMERLGSLGAQAESEAPINLTGIPQFQPTRN